MQYLDLNEDKTLVLSTSCVYCLYISSTSDIVNWNMTKPSSVLSVAFGTILIQLHDVVHYHWASLGYEQAIRLLRSIHLPHMVHKLFRIFRKILL